MSYSFTEKKRIRKSFAKRASVLPIPFLLATQIESYAAFLQAQVEPDRPCQRGFAGSVYVDFSDREPFQECPPRFRQLCAGLTSFRCQGMPAARTDLRLSVARQGSADDHGQGSFQADD